MQKLVLGLQEKFYKKQSIMKTKGIFEVLPNCISLQEIIDYLDSRNYDERKEKEEFHEMYEEGSIILNNKIIIECEDKNRVQIRYSEFHRSPIMFSDIIVHQPSWLIVPTTYSNDVWVKGDVVCYFTQKDEIVSDPYMGKIKCKHSIKRVYSGSVHCPYTELTTQKLESMLTESIRNIQHIIDVVRYDDITDNSNNSIPIILKD